MATSNQFNGNGMIMGMATIGIGVLANTIIPCSGLLNMLYGLGGFSIAYDLLNNKDDDWSKLFKATGVRITSGNVIKVPLLQERTKTTNGYMLRFNCIEGCSLKVLQDRQEAFESYIGKKINITYNNKNFFIEVFDKTLATNYPYKAPEVQEKMKGVYFPVGYSLSKLEYLSLSPENPHLLCAGTTGSGKSVWLRATLTSILSLANSYDSTIKLHCVDFKYGAEFGFLRRSKYVSSFSRDVDECITMLREMKGKINERYDLFFKHDVVDINEYNFKNKTSKMPYELIFIDEFACLVDSKNKEAIEILIDVAQRARAAGIYLVIATQRPDSKTIDGRIKQCFTSVVGLKCKDNTNSQIIIDRSGLEDLRGKGHGILVTPDGKETEIQGMFLTSDQAKKLIQHTFKKELKHKAKGKLLTPELRDELFGKKKKGFKFAEAILSEKE